jgi:predicted ATP-dependent serine protease
MSKTVTVFVCPDCGNVAANLPGWNTCPECGAGMNFQEVTEIETEHQLIRKLENAIYTDEPLPPVVIFFGKSDSAWGIK